MGVASENRKFYLDTRVMVTGACGFIGSHLVERLVEMDAHVIGLDNLHSGQIENLKSVQDRITLHEADVCDLNKMERLLQESSPHIVFHLAANASVPGSVREPVYDFQANSVGTFNVLQALRNSTECRKIVLASSGAVYGEPTSFPLTEESPLRPISPYGASKLNSEVTAQMMQRVYGVPVVIARLFNTYGPRMARFVILDFLRKLRRDRTRLEVLGSGNQVRDFTYVADTVAGLLTLARQGIPGVPYNVSSGISTSVAELARRVIIANGLEGCTEIAYTGSSWVGDAQRWEVSISKIMELGYLPCTGLDQGLIETIAWFASVEGDGQL